MNPQVTQPYPQNPVSKLASWDYAAGGLHPVDYNNRLSAIMVATMWSHLVAVFADLPAPGPAYDGGQLFKACRRTQKTSYTPFMVGIIFLFIVCLPFTSFVSMSGDPTLIMVLPALSWIMAIGAEVASRIARCKFHQTAQSPTTRILACCGTGTGNPFMLTITTATKQYKQLMRVTLPLIASLLLVL